MPVTISPQAEAILALCEKKIALQNIAESLNTDMYLLLAQIKALSDRQADTLVQMSRIDDQIERLAHAV